MSEEYIPEILSDGEGSKMRWICRFCEEPCVIELDEGSEPKFCPLIKGWDAEWKIEAEDDEDGTPTV